MPSPSARSASGRMVGMGMATLHIKPAAFGGVDRGRAALRLRHGDLWLLPRHRRGRVRRRPARCHGRRARDVLRRARLRRRVPRAARIDQGFRRLGKGHAAAAHRRLAVGFRRRARRHRRARCASSRSAAATFIPNPPRLMALIFERIQTEGIAELSYLLGDDSDGVAAVFDPTPDVDKYVDAGAREEGLDHAHFRDAHPRGSGQRRAGAVRAVASRRKSSPATKAARATASITRS